MTTSPIIVGAYAALPEPRDEQEQFYTRLYERGMATGLEIPFRQDLVDTPEFLAEQAKGRFRDSIITLIPGTMMAQATPPAFGLASPEEEGRQAALKHLQKALDRADEVNQITGEQTIRYIHLHSAPTAKNGVEPSAEIFARSLSENRNLHGITLIIEHCDRFNPEVIGEKKYLAIEKEIEVARETGHRVTVNWGRSVLESYDPNLPKQHIELLVDNDVLGGVMISGAGGQDTQFGKGWADTHLPLDIDEPTSVMTKDHVRDCVTSANGKALYLGAKIQVPAGTPDERLNPIEHITDLLK